MSNQTVNRVSVKNVSYLETSRGVAYTAPIYLDEQEIGLIENRGDGGATTIFIEKDYREEFNQCMHEYFKENPVDAKGMEEEVFADVLLDIYEFGRVLTEEEKIAFILAS